MKTIKDYILGWEAHKKDVVKLINKMDKEYDKREDYTDRDISALNIFIEELKKRIIGDEEK